MQRQRILIPLFTSLFIYSCSADDDMDSSTPRSGTAETVAHGVTFENTSAQIAYARNGQGEGLGGVAWIDYDQDADLDLYLTNGVFGLNGLFRNEGDGTFTDVTLAAGAFSGSGNSGVAVADIDNDGFPDIFLTGEGRIIGPGQTPTRFYHNNGDGTFDEITATAGVPGAGSALGATFGDINGDGFVDLFIASTGHIGFAFPPAESDSNKLYLNNGDLTFTDITESAGVTGFYDFNGMPITDGACVSTFTDYDEDGDADLLVGNCNAYPLAPGGILPVRATPFILYRNNGDLTFTDVTLEAGLDVPGFWMGLAMGDYNNDGHIDFFATSSGALTAPLYGHALMRNNGDGTFTNVAPAAGVADTEFGWGSTMADFDNDGDLDLFEVGAFPFFGAIGPGLANPGRLFFNDGAGAYADASAAAGIDLGFEYSSGVAQGDYDGDGFADLVIMISPWDVGVASNPNGAPVLLRNRGNSNHAVTVRLVGTQSNRSALGARVEFETDDGTQVREVRSGSSMASTQSPWPSVGIGFRDEADVRVTWPSGLVEEFEHVQAGALATLVEGQGESEDGDSDGDNDEDSDSN